MRRPRYLTTAWWRELPAHRWVRYATITGWCLWVLPVAVPMFVTTSAQTLTDASPLGERIIKLLIQLVLPPIFVLWAVRGVRAFNINGVIPALLPLAFLVLGLMQFLAPSGPNVGFGIWLVVTGLLVIANWVSRDISIRRTRQDDDDGAPAGTAERTVA